MPFNEKDWLRRVQQAETREELVALAMEMPDGYSPCSTVDAPDSPMNRKVPRSLGSHHFTAMAAIHGMHAIPPGVGMVYRMEPGMAILLNSKYDSWIPNDEEPLTEQLERVSLSPKYARRRESGRLRRAVEALSSPAYRARMMKVGLLEYLKGYSDGVIL